MAPIRRGDGTGIGSIRLGDGTEVSEVRTGDGQTVFSAGPDGTQSNPFTSPTQAFNAGVSNGVYFFQFNSAETTSAFEMAYASYDGKGWVEVLFSENSSSATPFDNWLVTNNGGPKNNTNYGSIKGLQNYGKDANFTIATYTDTSGVNLVGSDLSATDFAITSKSGTNVFDVNATGQNEEGVLPLTSDSLSGSDAPQITDAFLDYFRGLRDGFHAGNPPDSDFDGGFDPAGSPFNAFETVLAKRDGSATNTEYHIVSGSDTNGLTYSPNVGYRDRFSGNHVGSWTDNESTKSSTFDINSSNVLSIWLTDG